MTPSTRRTLLKALVYTLAALAILGAAYAMYQLQQPRSAGQQPAAVEPPPPPSETELRCIEELLARDDLAAAEVEPALALCRAAGAEEEPPSVTDPAQP